MYVNIIKRLFDVIASLILLLVLLPILLFTCLALFVVNKGNPFFIQQRPGKNSNIFRIIKFKTMNDKKDRNGKLLSDAERLTKIGKFVRKFSLDELPQLINVVKGDMSFIGPRPLLPEYLSLYDENQKRRHEVRPGITGWAQVNGRNAISWEEKFKMDVWYVDNCNFRTDLIIFARTIISILKATDVSSQTSVTMEAFTGTKEDNGSKNS